MHFTRFKTIFSYALVYRFISNVKMLTSSLYHTTIRHQFQVDQDRKSSESASSESESSHPKTTKFLSAMYVNNIISNQKLIERVLDELTVISSVLDRERYVLIIPYLLPLFVTKYMPDCLGKWETKWALI